MGGGTIEVESLTDGEGNEITVGNLRISESGCRRDEEECPPCPPASVKYEFVKEEEPTSEDDCGFVVEGTADDSLIRNISYTSKENELCEPIQVCFDTDYCDLQVEVKAATTERAISLEGPGRVCFDTPDGQGRAISNFTVVCVDPTE
ncbi:hypothetical protein ACNSTU_17490 [Aquisalimonas sp. APHAB1-3]|uniref:hypothetical protein n=1 Tax=Aquisalimonas sp. APHAB1-3 TaxID=3402080 RepID=UPI003AAD175E